MKKGEKTNPKSSVREQRNRTLRIQNPIQSVGTPGNSSVTNTK